MPSDEERKITTEGHFLSLMSELGNHDVVALVQSPVDNNAPHFVDGKLCACSHGLKCGPLDDIPNAVIPDGE